MSSKPILQVFLDSYSHGGSENLLSHIKVSLHEGARVAITGPNGSGKTTFLKIIAGILEPSGTVIVRGEVTFVPQHLRASTGLHRSGGEARRDALEEALASDGRVLLFDEPTNDLDREAKGAFLRTLSRRTGDAAIIVSHDPDILDLVDEIWELKNCLIVRHPPGFDEYLERLRQEEIRLTEVIAHLESESRKGAKRGSELIERQQKRLARGKKAGAKKNLPKILRGARKERAELTLAGVSRAQNRLDEHRMRELTNAQKRLRELTFFKWDEKGSRPPEGKRMVQIRGALLSGITRPLDFEFAGPKRIHLRGRNGSGKTTLLHALAGDTEALSRARGYFYAARPLQLFDQRLSQFTGSQPVCHWFQSRIGRDLTEARSLLGMLGFEQEEQMRSISALSGGERVRLELAAALHQPESPQLLLLDEPTNHLDPESRNILDQFLSEFQGAMIIVSHDRRLVESMTFDACLNLDEFVLDSPLR